MKMYFIGFVLLALLHVSCSEEKSYNIILLPDTRTYTSLYPQIFKAQTQWIADNADNISFVLHHGDFTDGNNEKQWSNAAEAMSIMDGKVPYSFVIGNHDEGVNSDTRDTRLFNTYFPYKKYSQAEGFGGAFETGKMDNTWHIFQTGNIKWLVLSLEFGPRNKVLAWADSIIRQYNTHKVIINTHAYMYSDNTRMGEGDGWLPQDYGIGKLTGEDTANNGEEMWDKLISQHSNILLVCSGHILHEGSGRLVSEGVHGNKVYQMLANYQDGVDNIKGDTGFLRILTITPKQKRIDIKTYSPYSKEYNHNNRHEFSFEDVDL